MTQAIIVRISLVWIALLAIFTGKSQLAILLFGPEYDLTRHIFMAVLTTALTVPMIVMVQRTLDNEPLAAIGLTFDMPALRQFGLGALAWFGPFLAGLAVCVTAGLVEIRMIAPWSEVLAFVSLLILLVFLLEALPEELAFRGYLQASLGKLVQPWLAVAIQAGMFGSWGVALWLITAGSIDVMHASMFHAMAAILGVIRVITGSIWTGIGIHLSFQTVAQLLLNAERGHFAIEGQFWLQIIALGMVPFSLLIPIVERFYRDRVDWSSKPA